MKAEEEQELCKRLASNDPTQTRVVLRCDDYSSLPAVFKALQTNTTVQELTLDNVGVAGFERCTALAEVFYQHPKLRHFGVLDMMGIREFYMLSFAMAQSKSLSSVSFEEVYFPEDAAQALLYLVKNTRMESIRIRDCWTSDGDDGCCCCCTSYTDLSNKFMSLVGHEKSRLDHVKTLELLNGGFGGDEAEILCGALPCMPALETLLLDGCHISSVCLPKLVKIMKEHLGDLRSLSLARNLLESNGAAALEDLLVDNKTLTMLNLSSNSIGSDGAVAIARGLCKNDTLQVLKLGSSDYDDFDHESCWPREEPGECLNLVGDDGAEAIAAMLECNVALEEMWLTIDDVEEKGLRAFASSLPRMRCVKKLHLEYWFPPEYDEDDIVFTEEVVDDFVRGLEKNVTLEVLDGFCGEKDCDERISHLLSLNRAGRRLVGERNVPLALWPHVLGSESANADAILFFLREKPVLYLVSAAVPKRKLSRKRRRGRKRRRIHLS